MNKDIITVKLKDGTEKDMELILLYYDEMTKINYVLYKEIESKDECYAAKYVMNNGTFDLDTNLSNAEINKLQLVLDTASKGAK